MSCDGVDRRAKLYFLDESGNWEHRSTGDIFIFQDGSDHLLILKSEDHAVSHFCCSEMWVFISGFAVASV